MGFKSYISRHRKGTVIGGAVGAITAVTGAAFAAFLVATPVTASLTVSEEKVSNAVTAVSGTGTGTPLDCSAISVTDGGKGITAALKAKKRVAVGDNVTGTSDTATATCDITATIRNTGDVPLYLNNFKITNGINGVTVAPKSIPKLPVAANASITGVFTLTADMATVQSGNLTGQVMLTDAGPAPAPAPAAS